MKRGEVVLLNNHKCMIIKTVPEFGENDCGNRPFEPLCHRFSEEPRYLEAHWCALDLLVETAVELEVVRKAMIQQIDRCSRVKTRP